MARRTRAAKKADAADKAEYHLQSAQSERENMPSQTRDDLLLEQQLLQTTYQMGTSSQSECSTSEVPQDSRERERDTAQKQVHLVNILAGVKSKRGGPASLGGRFARVEIPRSNSTPTNHKRGMPTPEPSGNLNVSAPKGATLYAMIEADAGGSADQGAEAARDKEETEDGSHDEADDNESNDEESANVGALDEKRHHDEGIIDESGTPHGENPYDSIRVEFYGEETAWNTILEGARLVGVSRTRRDKTQVLPRLKTTVIGSLIRNAQKAGNLFEKLIQTRKEEDHQQIDDLEKRLAKKLNQIKEQVQTITEANAGTKGSEIITDIYAHAIPNLVETLQWGLLCQSDYYSRSNDFEKLKSIVSIQDTILLLCRKALSWRAKTQSSSPIVKATTQKILPYLQSLREAFADEYEERKRVRQNERSQSVLIESHEKLHEKRQRQKADNEREQERKRRIMAEDLDRRYKEIFGPARNVPFKNLSQPQVLHRPPNGVLIVPNEWTTKQDRALLIQLMKEDIRHLPARQRYLATLNTPLLQNKLPEHIRERALYFKDALEIEWGDQDFVRSIE